MGDNDLNQISDNLYDKSQKLLSKFKFLDIASKYFNKVDLVGSAASNLMYDADIDINCQAKSIDRKETLRFVEDLLDIDECKKVILYNHIDSEKPFFIINVEKFEFEGERWIVTFFISNNINDTVSFLSWVRKNLTPERRQTILKLKKLREENKQKRSIPSHLIYKAAIEENVTTNEDFKKYLSSNGIDPDKKDDY
jgi:hypothetical protein